MFVMQPCPLTSNVNTLLFGFRNEFSKIIIFYGIFDIMPQILLIDHELYWALGIPQCYGLHKLYIYRANLRPQFQKDCAYVNNV